jgi:DNA-binding MarR family transcriptional regulator
MNPTTTPDQQQLAARVLRQFRLVFGEVRHHFQEVERRVGVGGAQLWALSEIGRDPGLGVSDLAQRMDIHPSTASNLVRQLLRKGLVVSDRSDLDRRTVQLRLTEAGLALLDKAPGPYEGVLPAALQQLPPETLAQLHQHLAALLRVLQPRHGTAQVPLAEL